MTPTISVALCSYNGEQFIGEQIASILSQSIVPDELVLSDDASVDSSIAIAEAAVAHFALEHPDHSPALRVLRNPVPLGVTKNFEQAVTATTGDFVVLCDQDDRWAPNRISRALEMFAARPTLLLTYSDAALVDSHGLPLGGSLFGALGMSARERKQIASGKSLSVLLGRNLVTGATTMFRRSLQTDALPFPSSWVHDEWLAVIAAAIGDIDFLPEQLIDYRQHGGNVIGAERIGFSGKLGKLREPREARNQRLVGRASDLVDRLTSLGSAVTPSNLELVRAKLAHEQGRLALPASRARRITPVVRELVSGGYSRNGRGARDALRDLVQPAS